MGHRIRVGIPAFKELGIEIKTASAYFDYYYHQC